MNTKVCKDRICKKLLDNEVRDRIFKGELRKEECDESDIYNFLRLLHRKNKTSSTIIYQEITIDKWREVVMKAKRMSTTSIFSKRNSTLYKCSLYCDVIMKILI